MREVSIARFVPVPTDTGSSNAFDAFYNVFADNPLILLIFTTLVVVLLLRWRHRTGFRRRHGPKLRREIDLYRRAVKKTSHGFNSAPPAAEEKPKPKPEFNVEGRRVN